MAKMNVKKGDKVLVLAGKDKGKKGEIIRSLPSVQRVVVEGVNMVKKAMRPTQQNPQGGIATMEAPIHVSNVMAYDASAKKGSRIGYKFVDGKKVRILKSSGKEY